MAIVDGGLTWGEETEFSADVDAFRFVLFVTFSLVLLVVRVNCARHQHGILNNRWHDALDAHVDLLSSAQKRRVRGRRRFLRRLDAEPLPVRRRRSADVRNLFIRGSCRSDAADEGDGQGDCFERHGSSD